MNEDTRQELVDAYNSFAEQRENAVNSLRDADTIEAEALVSAVEICNLPVMNSPATGNIYLFTPCEGHLHFLVFSEVEDEEGVLKAVDECIFDVKGENHAARFEYVKSKSNSANMSSVSDTEN